MQYVEVAGRAVLVIVFALALAGKVSSRSAWAAFVASLRRMDVVGEAWMRAAAVATVVAEAAIVVLALVPVRPAGTAAFVLAAGLLGALTVAVARVVRRGAAVACRCFGVSDTPLSMQHVVRNLTLVVVAVLGLAGSLAGGAFQAPMVAVIALAGAVAGLLVTRWDDLAALMRTP
ncbi:MauE/DoxX family redox-associated membrane protein [Dactylosporangium sp. NPDC051485]|uniref:MauE/DoxX family redox-associated membrane protein n=1 Tax=Dactylosporangium sp. NPDC051485 TaxID=3154846 RepID=UPI00341BE270